MTDETLVMAEELTSLRLYANLLRARLSGTVIQQQERLRHMTRRVRLSIVYQFVILLLLEQDWHAWFVERYGGVSLA